ncbi:MAG: hypothetical protein H7839_11450 [Magnetococcus sp. YQC-5]
MEPMTTVLLAAVPYVADKVGGHLVKDAYERVKGYIKNKMGRDHQVIQAIQAVEAKPDSEGRKLTLNEEVVQAQLHQDKELLQLVESLHHALSQGGVTFNNTTINVGTANHSVVGQNVTIHR